MTYQQAHDVLAEYQQWRRGIGQYEWQPDPKKNLPIPYEANVIGEAIDRAIDALAAVVKRKGSAK